MIFKVIFVIIYWLIIFVVTRLLEMIGVIYPGLGCTTRYQNTSMLDVSTIMQLLDRRGLSYYKMTDKRELLMLLAESGDLSEGEILLATDYSMKEEDILNNHLQFDSMGEFLFHHLHTEVWLVQILFNESVSGEVEIEWTKNIQWINLIKTVQNIGLHTASLMCLDSECVKEGWVHGQPVLILPYGEAKIFYQSFKMAPEGPYPTPAELLEWLTPRLLRRIHRISSASELHREWLTFNNHATWRPQRVNVIWFDNQENPPPLFIACLSVQFEGRIRIGRASRSLMNKDFLVTLAANPLLIVTPETVRPYGTGKSECLTVVSMRMLLASLAPSSADVDSLLLSLCLMVCVIELFTIPGGFFKRIFFLLIWFTKLMLLCIVWVVSAELIFRSFDLEIFYNGMLSILRIINMTYFADQLRSDWLRYSTINYGTFVVSYLIYCTSIGWCFRNARYHNREFLDDSYRLANQQKIVEREEETEHSETLWSYLPAAKMKSTAMVHFVNRIKVTKFSQLFSQFTRVHTSADVQSQLSECVDQRVCATIRDNKIPNCSDCILCPPISLDSSKPPAEIKEQVIESDASNKCLSKSLSHVDELSTEDYHLCDASVSNIHQSLYNCGAGDAATLCSDCQFNDNNEKYRHNFDQIYEVVVDGCVCLLCCRQVLNESEVSVLPCDHIFHAICLVSWIEQSNHCCPLCHRIAYIGKNNRFCDNKEDCM